MDNIERRRRDLNPRAATNDLLPFQGSPFGQLGYFSKKPGSKNPVLICLSHYNRFIYYNMKVCPVIDSGN